MALHDGSAKHRNIPLQHRHGDLARRSDLNVRQFYRLTRIDGPRRTGTVTELSGRLPVPPPNIGPRSTPNYGALGGGIQSLPGNITVFAGQRDEGFYVDLGIFDLLGVGSGRSRTARPAST
jgi:hypothetical protein